MQNYFGCTSANALNSWRESGSIMYAPMANIISSSCHTKSEVWAIRSFTNIEALGSVEIYKRMGKNYKFDKYKTFAVCKF